MTTSTEPTARLLAGDCIEVMAAMEPESVDAIVTDPPYGLEFMGREWDSFRVDERSARWASRSGNAGAFGESHLGGAVLPSYTKRRTTSRCLTCGKRDAFRNPHPCDETGVAEWRTEYVDRVPVEMRAFQEWCERWATEAYRVAKPGAHLLAFGGTRTYHRLATAIEEAGWDVRDCLVWGYATGFPKSMDLERAAALADCRTAGLHPATPDDSHVCAPSSDAAERAGWGTALKPAWEPIVMARKALTGSVLDNVRDHGAGALNIDAGRIPMSDEDRAKIATGGGFLRGGYVAPQGVALEGSVDGSLNRRDVQAEANDRGRWPANVMLTDPIYDGQFPTDVVGGGDTGPSTPWRPTKAGEDLPASPGALYHIGSYQGRGYSDEGTYSRFFLVPKASRPDREPNAYGRRESGILDGPAGALNLRTDAHSAATGNLTAPRANTHPTVKPLELMRHLVRIVTPPGGVVLDPFLGSGTTALACEDEGFGWIGIERDPQYMEMARARLAGKQRGFGL